jgi:aminomethyltransferase
MKTPVLKAVHEQAGARMGEFAGWNLPIHYGSAVREVEAVRRAAGIFDVSHMGRLDVFGPDALPNLQRLLTNDASKLTDTAGQYTLMCNSEGGVIDDLIVFQGSEDSYGLVVNASNLNKDKYWIAEHLAGDVQFVDCTPNTALVALQGPNASRILTAAGMPNAHDLRRFHLACGKIAGSDLTASRTGYTGEDGFEIACTAEAAAPVWNALMSAGEPFGIAPCGLAARDVLRTEAGLPLYGHEMDEQTTPVEAGLMRWVKLDKEDFIGRDAIATAAERGPSRRLTGIRMEGRFVPRPEDPVHTSAGDGIVTSGTFSPTLGFGIAMAYVPSAASEGQSVEIMIHGKARPGVLQRLPLYSKKLE